MVIKKEITNTKIPCFFSDLHRGVCLVELARRDDLHDFERSDRRQRFVCPMTFALLLFRNTLEIRKKEKLASDCPKDIRILCKDSLQCVHFTAAQHWEKYYI